MSLENDLIEMSKRPIFYILKGKRVVPATDLLKWTEYFESADRTIKRTQIYGITISTVFLGIDHGFRIKPSLPVLFETMIFGGRYDQYQERCCTYNQALVQHEEACELVINTPFILKSYYAIKYTLTNFYWCLRHLYSRLFRHKDKRKGNK